MFWGHDHLLMKVEWNLMWGELPHREVIGPETVNDRVEYKICVFASSYIIQQENQSTRPHRGISGLKPSSTGFCNMRLMMATACASTPTEKLSTTVAGCRSWSGKPHRYRRRNRPWSSWWNQPALQWSGLLCCNIHIIMNQCVKILQNPVSYHCCDVVRTLLAD